MTDALFMTYTSFLSMTTENISRMGIPALGMPLSHQLLGLIAGYLEKTTQEPIGHNPIFCEDPSIENISTSRCRHDR